MIIQLITVFILALYLGVELITKVPSTLHTPLMSGHLSLGLMTQGPLLSGLASLMTTAISQMTMPQETSTGANGLARR
jgi:NAD(P) transhydrogenase subunit alpha